MKNIFLLQVFYVFLIFPILTLLWEYYLERVFFFDANESVDEKIEYVLTMITFILFALIYHTYRRFRWYNPPYGNGYNVTNQQKPKR